MSYYKLEALTKNKEYLENLERIKNELEEKLSIKQDIYTAIHYDYKYIPGQDIIDNKDIIIIETEYSYIAKLLSDMRETYDKNFKFEFDIDSLSITQWIVITKEQDNILLDSGHT